MRVGLIDVDGHNFPNLALMRISAWHKAQGDVVEWHTSEGWYDIVYMSKIFSDIYSKDIPPPTNTDCVIRGGTGYCIETDEFGIEYFDKSKNNSLPPEVERMFPDYSIYPQYNFAVSMTSRGCPRGCAFCHVADKEGRGSKKVANVSDFYCGQPEIKVLDPNITACCEKRDLFAQYREVGKPRVGAHIDFTQGLDIRLINDADIDDINHMRIKNLHFAWDNPKDDLEQKFRDFAKAFRRNTNIGTVYCLTNFNSTLEEDLYRIYTLRDMGYWPYVMVYNKPDAPQYIRDLQRWCNNRFAFAKAKRFEDYDPHRKGLGRSERRIPRRGGRSDRDDLRREDH